jgi:hypothetical protein
MKLARPLQHHAAALLLALPALAAAQAAATAPGTPVLLQVNYRWDVSEAELARLSDTRVAQAIAATPGLRWKIYLRNPQTREAGGVYLFDTRAAAQAFLDGAILARVRALPTVSLFEARLSDVRTDVTQVTRGPLQADTGR